MRGLDITQTSVKNHQLKQVGKTRKRTCKIVDFAVPADHRIKLKECEKKDKYPFQPSERPGPVLDFGPERGPGKGTMVDLEPLIRHLVSTRLPSGGRAAFLSPLSPLYGTRPCV